MHIGSYTPETIPMARLAEYMQGLANIFGYEDAVHFRELKPGSACLVADIDDAHSQDVAARLTLVNSEEGDPRAKKAYDDINKILAADRTNGFICEEGHNNVKILEFPGVHMIRIKTIDLNEEKDSLEGILIRVGGKGQYVHLQLQDGQRLYSKIEIDRETARRIAMYLFRPVRLFGKGRWLRDEDGKWVLLKFRVHGFEELEESNFEELLKQLRAKKRSRWGEMDDPMSVLMSMRHDDDGMN